MGILVGGFGSRGFFSSGFENEGLRMRDLRWRGFLDADFAGQFKGKSGIRIKN